MGSVETSRTGGAPCDRLFGSSSVILNPMPARDIDRSAEQPSLAHVHSRESLRLFLASLDPPLSAETVYGVAQMDIAIRCMEAEFGLLVSVPGARANFEEVRLRSSQTPISFMYREGLVFPGFQFTQSGVLQPAVTMMLENDAVAQHSGLDLALWMMSPSGYLDDARPVDCLANPRSVALAAAAHFGVIW